MEANKNMDTEDRNKQIDKWLDTALAEYGNAEPRMGLETRVLSNLRAKRERRREGWQRWWPALAAVAAMVLVFAVLLFSHRGVAPPKQSIANTPRQTLPTPSPAPSFARSVPKHVRRPSPQPVIVPTQDSDLPRLATFPSQQRDDQAQLLRAFVKRAPATEIRSLVARPAQANDLQIAEIQIPSLEAEELSIHKNIKN